MTPHQVLASLGLVLDIIGAIWIVKSIITGRDDELARASDQTTIWAGGPGPSARPELLKILRDSRRDARAGAVLLVLGSGGQLASQWF